MLPLPMAGCPLQPAIQWLGLESVQGLYPQYPPSWLLSSWDSCLGGQLQLPCPMLGCWYGLQPIALPYPQSLFTLPPNSLQPQFLLLFGLFALPILLLLPLRQGPQSVFQLDQAKVRELAPPGACTILLLVLPSKLVQSATFLFSIIEQLILYIIRSYNLYNGRTNSYILHKNQRTFYQMISAVRKLGNSGVHCQQL